MSEPLRWSDRVSEGEPITRRLRHRSYTVAALVPPDFGAYARLLHPIDIWTAAGRTSIRWRQLLPPSAPAFDRRVQFAHLAESTGADLADQPPIGSLPIGDAQILVRVLARFTTTPAQCWFCLWDGFGWPNTIPLLRATATSLTRDSLRTPPAAAGSRVRTPDRDYLLYSGPVEAALALADVVPAWPQTPNLWWPTDRTWCVATEVDLDSSYVGGTPELINSLLAEPGLEALPANPDDRITLDADR